MIQFITARTSSVPLYVIMLCASITLSACHDSDAVAPIEPPPEQPEEPPTQPLNSIQVLSLETYDGSGQVVHPDVTSTPDGWAARRRHLAITPYPNGQSSEENPSIFVANNEVTWRPPADGINPLVRPKTSGYLSDPDILYNTIMQELWMYYREVLSENEIYLIRSKNGIVWGKPKLVVHAPNHQLLSPSVVHRGSRDWLMWSVNAGGVGCGSNSTKVELRRSQDGIQWSAPEAVSLPNDALYAWHIDVVWVPSHSEFWAVYNAKTPGSCTTTALFFATSKDGLQWTTFKQPLLERGVIPEFQDIVYRSTLKYDKSSDEITFWYSGARYEAGRYNWQSAVQRRTRGEVFSLAKPAPGLNKQQLAMRRSMVDSKATGIPALSNETAP